MIDVYPNTCMLLSFMMAGVLKNFGQTGNDVGSMSGHSSL